MYATYPLLHHLPAIRRARGGYLYSQTAERYLDLWLEGGRQFAGHQPTTVGNAVKNVVSQSLLLSYPNSWQSKLEYTLMHYFQAKQIYISDKPLALTFQEPWQHSAEGYYKLRAFHPLPSNASMAVLDIALSGYHIVLSFSDRRLINIPCVPLPAYLARFALKMLTLWSQQALMPTNPFVSDHFEWQYPYFRSKLPLTDYEPLFLKALKANILLPPANDHWGLWRPDLFSPGQIVQINTTLS